jgi:Flp pilus assembly protein TadD
MDDDLRALMDAGIESHIIGDLEAALTLYGMALELDPGNAAVVFNIGCIFEEAGRLTDAAEAFAHAATLSKTKDPDILAAARSYKGGVN